MKKEKVYAPIVDFLYKLRTGKTILESIDELRNEYSDEQVELLLRIMIDSRNIETKETATTASMMIKALEDEQRRDYILDLEKRLEKSEQAIEEYKKELRDIIINLDSKYTGECCRKTANIYKEDLLNKLNQPKIK